MNERDKVEEMMASAKKHSPMRQALDALMENLNQIIEYQQAMAQVKKAQFDALMKEGFTEKQALEIVAKSGLFL